MAQQGVPFHGSGWVSKTTSPDPAEGWVVVVVVLVDVLDAVEAEEPDPAEVPCWPAVAVPMARNFSIIAWSKG
jgi:hypothetical protein